MDSVQKHHKKKLFLSTETFPYDSAENSFILPELPELLRQFDVTIISHASADIVANRSGWTPLPETVRVVNIEIKLPFYRRLWYALRFFTDRDGWAETTEILRSHEKILTRLYQSVGFYALAMENWRLLRREELFPENEEFIFYSYWYFYYTYSMTKHRKQYPKAKLTTRTHRFDLFDAVYKGGRQPFKRIMDRKLDRIFFIAAQGKQYYLDRYHLADSEKYAISRLGTLRDGDPVMAAHREQGRFRLVSCSSVIPLKRVDLIAGALCGLTEKIEWVHFGDGSEYEALRQQTEALLQGKDNIVYHFKGNVPNQEVLAYYRDHKVDCFISTSSSEGLPVSMQEAMSYGIPLIATAVGGVSELIDGNGILLPADPTAAEVAVAIRQMIHMDSKAYENYRKRSLALWQQEYDAVVNRARFVQQLKEV